MVSVGFFGSFSKFLNGMTIWIFLTTLAWSFPRHLYCDFSFFVDLASDFSVFGGVFGQQSHLIAGTFHIWKKKYGPLLILKAFDKKFLFLYRSREMVRYLLLLNPPKKIHFVVNLSWVVFCFIFITTLSTKGEDGHQTFLSILPLKLDNTSQ